MAASMGMGREMIDWNKPIETVDGLPARVISTDYKGYGGLHIYVVQIEGRHFSHIGYYKVDGNPHATCDRIRNVRVKRKAWIRLPIHDFYKADTKEECEASINRATSPKYKAVYCEWEE